MITSADGPASEFYYNGKTMVAFAPAENLVAIAEAPPTIDAALKVAYESAAIYYPFTDVIVADPYKGITDGLMTAFYIGQSKVVAGTTTDMVAYADKDVFVQIWIGTEDKLPRMARAVYRSRSFASSPPIGTLQLEARCRCSAGRIWISDRGQCKANVLCPSESKAPSGGEAPGKGQVVEK